MYHLGGRSLQITLISVNSGIYRIVDSVYDDNIGGGKFDEVLVQHLAAEFKRFFAQYNYLSFYLILLNIFKIDFYITFCRVVYGKSTPKMANLAIMRKAKSVIFAAFALSTFYDCLTTVECGNTI